MVASHYGFAAGLIVSLAGCVGIGITIGVINLRLRVPPMITTLAIGFIIYSVILIISTKTTGMPPAGVAFFRAEAADPSDFRP